MKRDGKLSNGNLEEQKTMAAKVPDKWETIPVEYYVIPGIVLSIVVAFKMSKAKSKVGIAAPTVACCLKVIDCT